MVYLDDDLLDIIGIYSTFKNLMYLSTLDRDLTLTLYSPPKWRTKCVYETRGNIVEERIVLNWPRYCLQTIQTVYGDVIKYKITKSGLVYKSRRRHYYTEPLSPPSWIRGDMILSVEGILSRGGQVINTGVVAVHNDIPIDRSDAVVRCININELVGVCIQSNRRVPELDLDDVQSLKRDGDYVSAVVDA